MDSKLTLKPVDVYRDYNQYAQLYMEVHGAHALDVWPQRQLIKAVRWGGIMVGFYTESGELVAVAHAIPGFKNGELIMPMQTCAVKATYRSMNLGYQLFLAIRAHALNLRARIVITHYDPLNSHNASLYIRKLGHICRVYAPDFFGPTNFTYQANAPTDRFLSEWHLDSPEVERRLTNPPVNTGIDPTIPIVLRNDVLFDGIPKPVNPVYDDQFARVLVEIPNDFRPLIPANPEAANQWRQIARRIFMYYMERNFCVVDFYSVRDDTHTSHYYLLQKEAHS